MLTDHLLSALIFLPLVGAFALLALFPAAPEAAAHGAEPDPHAGPSMPGGRAAAIRLFALVVSLATFALSCVLLARFQMKAGYQFLETADWLPMFGAKYTVGIDGISVLLVALTTFLSVLAIGYSFTVTKRIKEYMAFLLVLESAMLGVFCALDLILFYVFWEAVLIPMYFLIGIWGHERRTYAAVKFFLYTFAGSVLMLVGLVAVIRLVGSSDLSALSIPGSELNDKLQGFPAQSLMWIYASFALAFMVKVPMFPFHTWLPDAHVEAPTAGSVILAGVMLKMGVYGFMRICLPMFPHQAMQSSGLFIALAVIGIIYGAVVAAVQPDMKKLVAYSSVSHLGYVMLGVFSFTHLGMMGALLQSINHGVSTGMLFFLVGCLYERRHTREISAFGGLKRSVPVLSFFFLVALLSSVALPLTNGFVGEFAILQGSYLSKTSGPVWTAVAAIGAILSAVYMLWLFQRVFAGPASKEENRTMPDLSLREKLVLVPLVVLVFWFGVAVTPWVRYMEPTITAPKLVRPKAPPIEYIALPGMDGVRR